MQRFVQKKKNFFNRTPKTLNISGKEFSAVNPFRKIAKTSYWTNERAKNDPKMKKKVYFDKMGQKDLK